jgi:hypothetical protein
MATALQDARIHYPVHKHPPTHKPIQTPTKHPQQCEDRYEYGVCTRRRRHKNPPRLSVRGLLVPSGPNSMPNSAPLRTRSHRTQPMSQDPEKKRTFTMFPPMSIIHPNTRRDEDVCLPRRPNHQHHHPVRRPDPPGPRTRPARSEDRRWCTAETARPNPTTGRPEERSSLERR